MTDQLERVTILRSSDAQKIELDISLSTTLSDLKSMICTAFGFPADKQQRIFHLGRELKSGQRTLEKLGIGRFRNFSLIVTSSPPRRPKKAPSPVMVPQAAAGAKASSAVIDLMDDSDDESQIVESVKRQRV